MMQFMTKPTIVASPVRAFQRSIGSWLVTIVTFMHVPSPMPYLTSDLQGLVISRHRLLSVIYHTLTSHRIYCNRFLRLTSKPTNAYGVALVKSKTLQVRSIF